MILPRGPGHQKKSKYKNWFTITSWDDPQRSTQFDYEGWFGVRELPEIREDAQGIVDGPKQYILAATRRWMDPNGDGNPEDGIDGWRLDVAFCIAHPFWVDWRKFVKSLNPEAYLTAEVVEPIPALKPYLQGDEFDAIMNYNFAFSCAEYFIEQENGLTTTEFDRTLRELREAFPPGVAYVMQNLFGSHDTNRLGSHIVNRHLGSFRNWGDYFGRSKAENSKYETRKPNPEELTIQKLFAIFQMTYIGAPMIYYGDEAGMWGANDPCCRKPMVWPDLEYDGEAYLPDGSKRKIPDRVEFNEELFRHYKNLIHIRNTHEALRIGDYKTLFIEDNKGLYVFSRNTMDETVIVMLRNNTAEHNVAVPLNFEAEFSDVLNENAYFKTHNGILSLPIKGHWGRILVSKK
jgi:cyclomaltodextrinase